MPVSQTLHKEKVKENTKGKRNAKSNKFAHQHSAIWKLYLHNFHGHGAQNCQETVTKDPSKDVALSVR